MGLNYLDWLVIAFYFLVIFVIAWYYSKKATKDTNQFFLSGRNLPWWLAGTAMVATTFAADTPLAVTELVAKNGIAGNWLWWNMAIGSMLTVFFYAKLWRRAEIVTDVEFVELRYSGKAAAVLRGFRAIYLGLFMNAIVLSWVNKAMEKIFQVTIPGIDSFLLVAICMLIISIYASASGLLGTARIDSIQFVIAMAGCILLAVIVLDIPAVGGISGMKEKLASWVFEFTPTISDINITNSVMGGALSMSFGAFFAHIGMQWWSSWYPGADPGGGGYIAQRMMSAKNESHSLFATLWFTIAHYTLRPWPWIIVALVSLILLPRLSNEQINNQKVIENYSAAYNIYKEYKLTGNDYKNDIDNPELLSKIEKFKDEEFYESFENTVDPGIMYPKLMVKYLPSGILGIMIAVFLSAYMSTISSQLNWGTSYLINDLYRRFINKNATEKQYVFFSRISIFILFISSLLITKYLLTTISGAWEFIINSSAGIGAVLILRWYWWRINAWSEISSMIAPLIIYPIAHWGFGLESPLTLYPTVLGTTIVWIIVTYLTKPTDEKTLLKFYDKIHVGGIGWRKFKEKSNVTVDKGYPKMFINWFFGVLLVYSTLFAFGEILFADYLRGFIFLFLAAISIIVISINIKSMTDGITN